MQCHAHAEDMCLHNVMHIAAEPPTQRDGTLYYTFSGAMRSQLCENAPHIDPLCMCPFGCQCLPHLGHLHSCKVLHHVLLKACPLYQGTVTVHMCRAQLFLVCSHKLTQLLYPICSTLIDREAK